jgi:ribosomal protein S25
MHLESVFNMLAKYKQVNSEIKIIPTEPIGIEFSEATIVSIAPKEWVLEKIGIDVTKYLPTATDANNMPVETLSVNEHIKGLKGREWQNMQRIIREFNKGKINREQASAMLKTGYALSDEEVTTWLGLEELEAEFSEEDYKLFFEFGDEKSAYNVWQKKTRFSDDTDYQMFAEVNQLESNILDQISKQKDITPEVLAQVLNVSVAEIIVVIRSLEERNIISAIDKKIGKGIDSNVVVERKLVKPLGVTIGEVKPTTTEMLVRYSYEWKSGFSDSDITTSRPFCKNLIRADKFYSRSEIEQMSARLGYSVWDRGGGWWTKKGTNTHSVSCRHEWKTNIVTRKK